MLAYYGDDRAGEDPFICGFVRVIIIDSPAGGIPAVDSVPCGIVGAVCYRSIDAAVVQAGESAGLIDNPCQCVGKGGVFDAVQNNGAYSHLACIRFPAAFSGDDPGQKVNIRTAVLALPLALGYAQGF